MPRYYDYYYYPRYTRTPPKEVKGGIKSQSTRAQTWWGKRWIEVLESFQIGARLSRGRSYARKGQVASIKITKGSVTAKVQGSRSTPYTVKIGVKALKNEDWRKLAAELAGQAIFSAKLLAGEMPEEIEQVFKAAGLSLFPSTSSDLKTDCSCPDWSNPCKHIAAVYYLLGEEFDRDPFLIFKLRGMTPDKLVEALTPQTAEKKPKPKSKAKRAAAPKPEPIAADEDSFWKGAPLSDDFFGQVEPPVVNAALVERLGAFPLWRGERPFLESIRPTFRKATEKGINAYLTGQP